MLKYLGYTKDNARSRQELSSLTKLSDREVRRKIAELRKEGHIICNTQDGKGYYLSDSTEDILSQYNQLNSRAMSLLVQRKFLQRKLKKRGYRFRQGGVAECRQE